MSETQVLRLRSAGPLLTGTGLLLLLVAAPLAWSPSAGASFVTPKLLVVYPALLFLALGLTLRSQPVTVDATDLVLAGLGLVLILSVVASPTPVISIFGGHNRGTAGLLYVASLGLVFVARRLSSRERAVALHLLLASAVVLVGLLLIQDRGLFSSIIQLGRSSYGNPGATLGNPNYAGGCLAAAVPVALLPMLSRAVKRSATAWAAYSGSYAVLLGGLYLTMSRGAILSMLATTIVAAVLAASWKAVTWKRSSLSVVVVVLSIAAASMVPWAATWHGSAGWNPIAGDSSLVQRWGFMKIASEAVAHKPLLGWGPGNFQEPWQLYADNETLSAEPGSWVTDSHNLFAEMAVGSGLPALLGLVVLLGRAVEATVRRSVSPENLAAFLVAASLLTTLSLNPQNLPLTPLLFFFVGISLRSRGSESGEEEPLSAQSALGARRVIPAAVCSLLTLVAIAAGFTLLRADQAYVKALVRSDGRAVLAAARNMRVYSLPYFTAGRLLARSDAAAGQGSLALEAYRLGLSLDPRNAYGLQSLAGVQVVAERPLEAIETVDEVLRLQPLNVLGRLVQARAFTRVDQPEQVPELVQTALSVGRPEPATFALAAEILEQAGYGPLAEQTLRVGVQSHPSDEGLQAALRRTASEGP